MRRSAAVLPDVRCRPGRCRGRAMMALVSPSRRSPGRCPQWRQPDPAPAGGAHVRDGPQQRPGAVRGRAELAFRRDVPGQLHRGVVDGGDVQALPQGRDPRLRVGAGRVQLEDLPQGLLAQQPAGLGDAVPAGTSVPGRPSWHAAAPAAVHGSPRAAVTGSERVRGFLSVDDWDKRACAPRWQRQFRPRLASPAWCQMPSPVSASRQ
jgi:hypothetical protein